MSGVDEMLMVRFGVGVGKRFVRGGGWSKARDDELDFELHLHSFFSESRCRLSVQDHDS
jgi:hypothetical protein